MMLPKVEQGRVLHGMWGSHAPMAIFMSAIRRSQDVLASVGSSIMELTLARTHEKKSDKPQLGGMEASSEPAGESEAESVGGDMDSRPYFLISCAATIPRCQLR